MNVRLLDRGLGPTALRLARAASVLAGPFTLGLAAAVADLSGPRAEVALEALRRAGVVRQAGGGRFEFVHPRFRQTLYEGLFPWERACLQDRAVEALLARALEVDAAKQALRSGLENGPQAAAPCG